MNGVQNFVLARHIMRFRRHRTQRRTPQNVFPATGLDQINQVRMTIRELFNADVVAGSWELSTEVLGQRAHVKFFAMPDCGGIGLHSKNVSGGSLK
jgi:hypothetical protein